MPKKRKHLIYAPHGEPSAQLTTLSYNYSDRHEVVPHYHEEHQLLFASKGVMTVRTARDIWVVPTLRAVWIPAKEGHSITMAGEVLMRTLYFAPKVEQSLPRTCFVLNVSSFFRELILYACGQKAWKTGIAKEERIIGVLLDQLLAAPMVPLQLPQPQDNRAKKVVDALLADPADSRTLDDLCQRAGASKRTIERVFMDETGMTFGKWRQQLRLPNAMRLLGAGASVINAGLDSGYNSPSAFISVFRKVFGQTPAQYLREQGAPEANALIAPTEKLYASDTSGVRRG